MNAEGIRSAAEQPRCPAEPRAGPGYARRPPTTADCTAWLYRRRRRAYTRPPSQSASAGVLVCERDLPMEGYQENVPAHIPQKGLIKPGSCLSAVRWEKIPVIPLFGFFSSETDVAFAIEAEKLDRDVVECIEGDRHMDRRTFLSTFGVNLLAASLAVEAQQAGQVARIGYLSPGTATANAGLRQAFIDGLRHHGWIEGQNIAIEYRWEGAGTPALDALAAELAQLPLDAIFAGTSSRWGREEPFSSQPPTGRVEGRRACCRWRVSSPALSITGWVHNSTMATFPAPATSNAACGFPALRFPARFMPRVMRPSVLGALSAVVVGPGSC